MTSSKLEQLKKVSTKNHIITALAFDQRGALKKMIANYQSTPATAQQIEELKSIVTAELTKYASAILLDPEYGLPAAKVRDENAGLILAYEKTGYDTTTTSRLPDCLDEWSVVLLKNQGAEVIKFLLYYDVDGDNEVNLRKQAFIERVGSECKAEGLPFFLEILSYDEKISDNKSEAFAKVKPRKVIEAMKEFSKAQYGVDVLKVEVPLNMDYVEGFSSDKVLFSKEEAANIFREQSSATDLPYIFLSAGVSAQRFQDTLYFAKDSGAVFNGVLCGRATWAGVVPVFINDGPEAAKKWLETTGRENIESLNKVLSQTATPWKINE